MYNKLIYSTKEHHHMMRGNTYSWGINRDVNTGKKYFMKPNGIYDFNAERWNFMDEFRLKGETNEYIEKHIGAFRNE